MRACRWIKSSAHRPISLADVPAWVGVICWGCFMIFSLPLWTSEIRLSFYRVPHRDGNDHEAFSCLLEDGIPQLTKCNCSGLELGQQLSPSELRTTEFAPAYEAEPSSTNESEYPAAPPHAVTYGPPQWARSSFTHGFPGSAFTPQPDGSLRCPANHPLYLQERRPERDGTLRVLYAARIGH